MKIGFVLDDSLDSADGVQQYVRTLGNWLTSQNHEVHYLVGQTSRKDIGNIHSLSRNFAVRFNKNRMTIPLPADKAKIKQLLVKENFDVLHVQMPYSPFMAGKVIAAAPEHTKLFGTFHILPYGRLSYIGAKTLSWFVRRQLKRFDHIWSVSEPAQTFAAHLGIKTTVLPNAVSVSSFEQAKPFAKFRSSYTIVFLGRLVPRKGCAEFLQAIKILREEKAIHKMQIVICGDGPQRAHLQAWAQRHNLDDCVTFAGFVTEKQKAQYLASADIAVFPSLGGESFGIVLVEAMAAGAKVVLGGDNLGYSSVLRNIPAALCQPLDTPGLAHQMAIIANTPELQSLIHNQQQHLYKQYDVNVIGKKLVSYYSGGTQ